MGLNIEAGPQTRGLLQKAIDAVKSEFVQLAAIARTFIGVASILGNMAKSLAEISEELRRKDPPPINIEGAFLVIKVKTDNPDVSYSFSDKVTDSEGNVITDPAVLASLVTAIESDNEDAVLLTPTDDKSGTCKFVNPGVATVTATVSKQDGTILGSGAVSFTVVTGDPAAVTNIGLKFGDLVDE